LTARAAGERGAIELSIVMPCLNEAATVGLCIDKAREFLTRADIVGEIVIADNGSSDGSREIAVARGVRVVEVPARGYGNALMGGFAAARGRYVIMGDADDSYDFSALDAFVDALRGGADIVLGNRFAGGIEPGAMPLHHRYIGNPVLSGIGRVLFKSPARDFHCGLRGFRRTAIDALALQTTGMEFASEMVVKALLRGLRVTEVATKLTVAGRNRPPHLRSWHDGWRHLRFLLVYSPRWLFLYPGIAFLAGGLAMMLALLPHPLLLWGHTLDANSLLYSGVFVVLGVQCIAFSILTKIFGADAGLLPFDERLERFLRIATLERGLLLGGSLVLLGCIGTGLAFFRWGGTSFGALDESVISRITVPSVTALAAGAEISFASFFISILRIGRVGARPFLRETPRS
jgi:glycosyltransferase involved in cell wall biosynthesis